MFLPRITCKRTTRLLATVLLALSLDSQGGTFNLAASAGGLSVELDAKSGDYRVISKKPAWTLGGSLATMLKNVTTSSRCDQAGPYRQLAFNWQAGTMPMSGQIRIYEGQALALFSQKCAAASPLPPPAFPDFTVLPKALHIFSYRQFEFAPPQFTNNDTSTPWLLFDDRANALLISPASHFLVASMVGDGRTEIGSGFNPNLRNVPAGFAQQTLLAFGQGINKTWEAWGRALRNLQGTKRPGYDADTVLKYLGYWTDSGAAYYYNYDLSKGYAGTLQALTARYRQERLPIRYLQLDSWWYYKTTTDENGKPGQEKKAVGLPAGEWNRYGGLLEYRAHTNLFPIGLGAFQKGVGLPLITHNRWIDPASPYHQQYRISGVAAVDPKWWDDISGYLKSSGVVTYEQDWLDKIYAHSPAFSSTPETGEAFLDDMARACAEQGITVQYCMAYPCYFMQGTRYANLTTIRVSEDRCNPDKWNNFLYTSRLAASAGIWPWTDVCLSTERNNVLLATLSAGPVGIGDAIGAESKTNISRAVRTDGVIVKPDEPIVPLDQCYITDAAGKNGPLMAGTFTDHDGTKTEYLFAFNRPGTGSAKLQFRPAELGLRGPVYVYDYFSATGKRQDASHRFTAPLDKNASAFYVIAPVGSSGIALLGDQGKFVGTGQQRIVSLHDEAGRLTTGVILAQNETSIVLHGYARAEPDIRVLAGTADAPQYDPATGYFTVEIRGNAALPPDDFNDAPVHLTVMMKTKAK